VSAGDTCPTCEHLAAQHVHGRGCLAGDGELCGCLELEPKPEAPSRASSAGDRCAECGDELEPGVQRQRVPAPADDGTTEWHTTYTLTSGRVSLEPYCRAHEHLAGFMARQRNRRR
jgi:hypothetical protein